MKWWEWVMLTGWPSSLGIVALLAWVRGHKAGVDYAHAQTHRMSREIAM